MTTLPTSSHRSSRKGQQHHPQKVIRWSSEDRLPRRQSGGFFLSLKRLSIQSLTKAKHKTGKFISSMKTRLMGAKRSSADGSEDSAYDTSEVCLSPSGRQGSGSPSRQPAQRNAARRQQSWSFHDLRSAAVEKPVVRRSHNLHHRRKHRRRSRKAGQSSSSSDSGVEAAYHSDNSGRKSVSDPGRLANSNGVTRVQVQHALQVNSARKPHRPVKAGTPVGGAGSGIYIDCAGSGIYIENSGQNFYFCHRNPDFSSVFKSELTAIKLGLEAIINESDYGELWILSDSRSSLQHLHNWTQVGDKTSISILHNLKLISKHHDVHFQWITSHADIFGNEQVDRLAREGCSLLTTSSPAITYSEHQSKINRQLSKEWEIPPSHHWYAAREPGSFLDLNCDRASKTAISDWLVDTRKVSPSLRAGRLLSSAPSARFIRPLPNISWTVWVFPEKTCTILPFLLSIF
ncbi:uncharacterized protein TNCV_3285171 [Trichonephila clavipes]|nr:uncharacterized protein TNCV_3285171 [Trichonephila clavipes]